MTINSFTSFRIDMLRFKDTIYRGTLHIDNTQVFSLENCLLFSGLRATVCCVKSSRKRQ